MNSSVVLNEALTRMAMSLRPEHWQTLVAVKGIPYPYSLAEKVKAIKILVNGNKQVQKQ